MPIIKERILNTGTDMNLKINLGSSDNFTGYQQEIDNLTQFTSNRLINPPVDAEVVRFSMTPDVSYSRLNFSFYSASQSPQHNTRYTYAGIDDQTGKGKQNSFFIMDLFDTYDIYTQRKIFSKYFTKLGTSNVSEYYISSNAHQFFYWNIPRYFLDEQTGTTCYAYVRFTFINAEEGNTSLFYNSSAAILFSSTRKMHFRIKLDLEDRTWGIGDGNQNINAKELVNNTAFINKVNNTYNKFDNIQQVFPDGNTYNYEDNDYLTI